MDKLTYKQWERKLDSITSSKLGLGFYDMPDLTCTYDLWEDGMSPEEGFEVCADAWAQDDSLVAEVLGF